MNYQAHQERLAIPKAAADEVPPGLTNLALQKHFGIGYYQVKLWVFHTGYKLSDKWSRRYPKIPREPGTRGRPAMQIPSVPLTDMPEGLCHYEVAEKLGVPVRMAKQWAASAGYNLIDGRSKYCIGQGQKKAESYRAALEAGAGKTLEELGKELGLTRERVRQLHDQLKIPRERNPHTSHKNAELVERVRQLAPEAKNLHEMAVTTGLSMPCVSKILHVHNIPFKSWVQKRLEQEMATGIRQCTVCHAPKPLTDYFKQHDGRLGKMERCKDCVNLKERVRRESKGKPARKDKREYWERLRRERAAKPTGRIYNSVDELVAEMPAPIQKKYHELGQQFGLTAEQINKLKEGKV